MEPIVSPWLIYWMSVCGGLKDGGIPFLIIGIMATVFYVTGHGVSKSIGEGEHKEWVEGWGNKKYLAVAMLVFGAVSQLFIPSSSMMMKMYAAKHITTDNLNLVRDAGKDLKDEIKADVIEIIEAVQKAKEDKP